MNVLVTGSKGQLGSEIKELASNYPVLKFIFTDVVELDISRADLVNTFFKTHQIDLVINCAAYTAVDKAEDEPELADLINNVAVKNLVEACQIYQAKIIHISTDYVFDGHNYKPYQETDKVNPKSMYGITKLRGEQQLLNSQVKGVIIRTSWVYSTFGNNFVKTMIRLGQERESLHVVSDQIGTPTYARDLAKACLDMASQEQKWPLRPEIYHFSNEGTCSWYDFAVAIMEVNKIKCHVMPIETKDYPTKAERPFYSILNKAKIKNNYKLKISHWQFALQEFTNH